MFKFFNFAFILFFSTITNIFSQINPPQGYFIMPINPGEPVSLSGAYGDIRTNHFHAGLDVRTGGKEGVPVYSAADGYVSRIKVQNGGYGNALYITHPNGFTTLYAHLLTMVDTVQKYLVAQQYAQKTWEIDIQLPPNLFAFKQGEQVAFSGNTGGSGGPHLHFEIRDKDENTWDPSQFGFYELTDYADPVIEMISLKTMSSDARVNGRFGIFNFPVLKKSIGEYTINQKITARGKIAVEVLAYDKTSNSPFRQGVNEIDLRVNAQPIYSFKLDKMAFHNKLDMNCHVNYDKMNSRSQKIHRCYVTSGNTLDSYKTNASKGVFDIVNGKNEVYL
ncbi:MAG: M23 family metallopeptidase, partial [Leadbetterella sp.]